MAVFVTGNKQWGKWHHFSICINTPLENFSFFTYSYELFNLFQQHQIQSRLYWLLINLSFSCLSCSGESCSFSSFLSDSVCNNQWYTSIMKLIFHNLQVQTANFPSSAFKDSPILNSPDNFHLPQFCLCPPEENNFDLGITWICSGAHIWLKERTCFETQWLPHCPSLTYVHLGSPFWQGTKTFRSFRHRLKKLQNDISEILKQHILWINNSLLVH